MMSLEQLRKDRAKYDTNRKRSGAHKTPRRQGLMNAPIVAIDGEGVTDEDGNHRYIMLASSQGSYIHGHSLSTRECLDFLLSLPGNALTVGFSISYDVCKWLRDMSREILATLWRVGVVDWGRYRIRWAPGKFISIRRDDGARIHIYDVFGFYQRSFVAALEEWNVGTSEQIERIRSMKSTRGSFQDDSFDDILKYCLEECDLLVQLVGKLRAAMVEGDIPLKNWYGAGAIASAIMEKEGVKKYLERMPPESWKTPVLAAYFGGRFELYKAGRHENVYTYDIRSAYPHIIRSLPCLTHMVYTVHDGYVQTTWGIYEVEWRVPDDSIWPPFPFRYERQIYYPLAGRGFYHASEVEAARRFYGDSITVLRSYVATPHCGKVGCDGKPFAFVPGYFEFRKELKRRGSQAQLTVKLGLNSLYGKTAQGVGWGQKKPPYQSYLWAGMITAGTRAMLLDAIRQNPDAIIWTATDGIVSTEPLDLDCGDELGQWEDGRADSVFSVQTGVYEVIKDGKTEVRTRGFGKTETSFRDIEAAFLDAPIDGEFSYDVIRFVGLGAALARNEFWRYFGRWHQMTRTIKFDQSKRFAEPLLDPMVSEAPPIRYLPPTSVLGVSRSAEYQPRASWVDLWEQNQDDETLETLVEMEQP